MPSARAGPWPHPSSRLRTDVPAVRYLGTIALFAALYFATAKLGLSYAFVQKNASPVWPPTGIALGVLLVYGRRYWPGVFVGALLVNYGTGVPAYTALGIAIGNTLEAFAATTVLRHFEFRTDLRRLRDVIAYVLAGVACTTLSATLGVGSLALSRQIEWASFRNVWTIWCVGDSLGAILVGPLIFAWKHGLPVRARQRGGLLVEGTAILLVLAAQTYATFTHTAPVAYTVFPIVLWAVFRFGLPGATSTTLVVATIAVWGTAHGTGPFVRDSVTDSLLYAQIFSGVVAIMSLVICATDAERSWSEGERARLALQQGALAEAAKGRRRLELLDRATDVLIGQALEPPAIFGAIACATLPDLGECYLADLVDDAGQLQRVAAFHVNPAKQDLAEELGRRFPPNDSDPFGSARVVQGNEPRLIRDVRESILSSEQRNVIRALGAKSVITVPMVARAHTLGVVTFVSSRGYTDEDVVLARVVCQRAALLLDNAQLLQQARRAVGLREQVLGVVAHDLRAPLAIIRAQTDRLSHPSHPTEPEDINAYAEPIGRAAARMQRLIEDLVDFASIEAGSLSLRRDQHEIGAIVADALELLRARAVGKSLRLLTDIPDIESIPPVVCDQQRVQQVLSNLVENAIKCTDPGGTITLSARVRGEEVELAVKDTGRGIPKDQLPHIFERFWRAPAAGVRGAGLGLSIAKGIVEAHGGRLWCESQVGAGTTFFFTLPISGGRRSSIAPTLS